MKVATLALLLCVLGACGGGGSGQSPSPSLKVNPIAVSFANQQVGSISPPIAVSVKNVGSGDLLISTVQLSGANAGACCDY